MTAGPHPEIFTVGHSNHPLEVFIALLKAHRIEKLADIRTVPRSRHNPQFGSEALATSLEAQGIEYRWFKNLGGLRKPRRYSPNQGWHNEGFRGYADYMQTPEFIVAMDALLEWRGESRLTVMCAEAVPWRCHRSLVGDALLVRGYEVMDIMSEISARPHKLTTFAEVRGEEITYPFALT